MLRRSVVAAVLLLGSAVPAPAALIITTVTAGSEYRPDGPAYLTGYDSTETLTVERHGNLARASTDVGVNRIYAAGDDPDTGSAGANSLWGANFRVGDSLDGSGRVQVSFDVRIQGSMTPDIGWPSEAAGEFGYQLGAIRGRVDTFAMNDSGDGNYSFGVERPLPGGTERIGLSDQSYVRQLSTATQNMTITRQDGYYESWIELLPGSGQIPQLIQVRYYPDRMEQLIHGQWQSRPYASQNTYAQLEASYHMDHAKVCGSYYGCAPGAVDQLLTVRFDVAANSEFFVYGLMSLEELEGGIVDFGRAAVISGITVGNSSYFTSEAPGLIQMADGRYNFASAIAASAAVPEPASWAMMIAGFGLVGGALRRRGTLAFA
ncbi:PEP-CTERM protein-sorting domain-containing protein [Sphingomonas laterariae]|uniref:PEP-CTERM protein-sorting domain-containing protein n=1 Tax=Edaphosphingomonas laterariae TaxID=861865 RepID=A0A239I6S6_9SPHN|nr:PEPxxWA-CTERM sorting domain-containing protein [Sphingomonas laterariae]SNS89290.1 PEP-CTERM protein-sorting domain-containing protein [Sphingomonas laterariae]